MTTEKNPTDIVPLQTVKAEVAEDRTKISDFQAYQQLSPALQVVAEDHAKGFVMNSDLSVTTFAAAAQANSSRVLAPIMKKITNRDLSGPTGTALNQLVRVARGLDSKVIDQRPPIWVQKLLDSGRRTLVNIGWILSPVAKFINDAKGTHSTLEVIKKELQIEMQGRIDRTADLEVMQGDNTEAFWNLMTWIAAGELIVEREQHTLEEMTVSLKTSTDPTLPQRVQEQKDRLFRMKTRVFDLKLTAMECFVTSPVIRETSKGILIVVDQLQKGIVQTIPQIERQIILIIAMMEQQGAARKAAALDEAHRQTTHQLGSLLGQANTDLDVLMTSKSKDIRALEELFGQLVDQVQTMKDLEEQLDQISAEGDAAYARIREQLKKVVSDI